LPYLFLFENPFIFTQEVAFQNSDVKKELLRDLEGFGVKIRGHPFPFLSKLDTPHLKLYFFVESRIFQLGIDGCLSQTFSKTFKEGK
jgi:hypothetical protein